MNLGDGLLLSIVDKLLIGVLLAIVGYWMSEALERIKGRIALQNSLAPLRAAAYAKLWAQTQSLTPRGEVDPSPEDCKRSYLQLRAWYYSENGAFYLSHSSTKLFLELLTELENSAPKSSKICASTLRTQMKFDLGIYTKKDSQTSVKSAG